MKLAEELKLFWEHEQNFGTQFAQESAKTSQPGKILFTLANNKMKICFKDHSFFFYLFIFGISIVVFIDLLYLCFMLYMELRWVVEVVWILCSNLTKVCNSDS